MAGICSGRRGATPLTAARSACAAWACPVCENELTLAAAAAKRLVDLTRADDTWHEWVMSAPWCLAHLGDVLAAAADTGRGTLDDLRDRQLAHMADIETRLDALAHDSAHGRREALTPEVRSSVKEAADILAGDD